MAQKRQVTELYVHLRKCKKMVGAAMRGNIAVDDQPLNVHQQTAQYADNLGAWQGSAFEFFELA